MRDVLRRLAAVSAAATLVGGAAACEPVENAPPGGGEVIEEVISVGTFDLAPMGQPGSDDEGFSFSVPRPSGSFGMKEIDFDIVDQDGNPVARSDVHLHHIVMMNSARQSPYCSNWPERFAGSGAERGTTVLPDPHAYLVSATDRWSATWHVMNTSSLRRQVTLQYRIRYQPGADATNSRPVTPFFLDVTGCSNSEYDVPGDGGPGSVHTATRTFTVPWDGHLVSAEGHQHGGGIDIALRDEATGLDCTMVARYEHGDAHAHAPDSITQCPIHVRVEQGQRFSLVSRYHNSQPVEGAMGAVKAYAWQGTQ